MKFYAEIDFKNKIVPCTDFDFDILRKITKNHTLCFEVLKKRNIKLHQKFFVLLNLLFNNQEEYINI